MDSGLEIFLAVLGGLLVVFAGVSVIGTVVVPRPIRSWLTRWVEWVVERVFSMLERLIKDERRRDAVLAARAPALLMLQLAAWLVAFLIGFGFLLLPFKSGGVGPAIAQSGSAVTTIGFVGTHGGAEDAIVIVAAFAALGTLALQIGYLPTLYAAYNRRETTVSLLNARAGVPSWGPELLARTHYGLGTGQSTLGTMAEFYDEWERWSADVAETHRTYTQLVYFRSPRALSSWVTAQLSVLDSAALYLALCPTSAPVIPARLCLRGGFVCLGQVAIAMGIRIPDEADPTTGISLTYDEFLEAVERLKRVDFPIERDPAEAWPHFVGWRVNYEAAAYAIAYRVSAPPAMWSGPRRSAVAPIPPLRPPDLRPPLRP